MFVPQKVLNREFQPNVDLIENKKAAIFNFILLRGSTRDFVFPSETLPLLTQIKKDLAAAAF